MKEQNIGFFASPESPAVPLATPDSIMAGTPTSPVPSLRNGKARRVFDLHSGDGVPSSWGVATSDVTIWECSVTGMRFRDAPDSREVASFYEADYHQRMTGGTEDSQRSAAYRKENEIRTADLRRYVMTGPVLDVGCSRGDFACALAQSGLDAYGLDIAPDACAEARTQLGEDRVFCETIEQLAERTSHRFAAVTAMDVIEHCTDVEGFLRAIHRILQPEGVLFLRTPTLRSPFHILGTLSYRLSLGFYKKALFKLYHAEHLYFFNEKSIRLFLNDCGFEVLDILADRLCWDNFRTAEMRQGALGNCLLAVTYFAGRAVNRGHGMKVIARRKAGSA